MAKFKDLADLPEDEHIQAIGNTVMGLPGKTVAFVVDTGPVYIGKAERYILKLLTAFPEIEIVERFKGPVPGTETIKVTRKKKGELSDPKK